MPCGDGRYVTMAANDDNDDNDDNDEWLLEDILNPHTPPQDGDAFVREAYARGLEARDSWNAYHCAQKVWLSDGHDAREAVLAGLATHGYDYIVAKLAES